MLIKTFLSESGIKGIGIILLLAKTTIKNRKIKNNIKININIKKTVKDLNLI